MHEHYSLYDEDYRENYDWDIAVIELPIPLTFNNYVQPVCLPTTPVADGTDCVVTGWGYTKVGKKQNLLLYSQLLQRSVANTL